MIGRVAQPPTEHGRTRSGLTEHGPTHPGSGEDGSGHPGSGGHGPDGHGGGDPDGRSGRSRRGVVVGAGAMALGVVGAVGLGLRPQTGSPFPGLPRRPAAGSAPVAPPADPSAFGPVTARTTSRDRSLRFSAAPLTRWSGSSPGHSAATVVLHPGATRQRFEGAGASLTQSSVGLLRGLPGPRRAAVLRTLFEPGTGAGITLLRQPLGSSDFSTGTWTYADRPTSGSPVPVTVGAEDEAVLAMVRRALHLNPRLQVIGTPWTAPAWMKTSRSLIGGTLRAACHQAYAQYLADVATAYERQGIFLTAISLQNEPGFAPPDYPGMTLSPAQQSDLVTRHVGPALARAKSATRLLLLDHNWSDIPTVLPLLQNAEVRRWVLGTAVHGYSGAPADQHLLDVAAPALQIWETECSGGTWAPEYGPDLSWDAHNLVVQGMRNGSGSVVFWNVALDRSGGPHLGGGGSTCRGVLTVDPVSNAVTPNVEYDVLRQLRPLVPGALRMHSTDPPGVETAAWRNPDGSFVVLASAPAAPWRGWLRVGDRSVPAAVPHGGLSTFSWSDRATPAG